MLQKSDYDIDYYNGGGSIGGYDLYSETTYGVDFFQQSATKFLATLASFGIDPIGKKILVVGCAYGYLVKHLILQGADAYGMDISPYAISQAPSEIADKLIVGDASLLTDLLQAKTLAGLIEIEEFDLIISEDMLCCLTDVEATTFCANACMHSLYFFHLTTEADNLLEWYNYHDILGWQDVMGLNSNEYWYSRLNWVE